MNKPTCTVPECVKESYMRSYCTTHYSRLIRTGSPTGSTKKTKEQFFWAKVEKTESCWLWTAGKTHNGYGLTGITGCELLAHRYSYTLKNGPIAKGMQIDHVCYTRECVNPSHLRAVTYWQNQENRAGANANNKTSGIRGVSWSAHSNRWLVQVSTRGKRYHGGLFETIAEAEAAAIALRNKLLTHNEMDRAA